MNPHGITIARILPLEVARVEEFATTPDEVDAELRPFFEEEAKAAMEAIETALQAWDAENSREPLKMLRHHFHTLKGAANSIGHVRIGALASGMEEICNQFNPAYAFVLRSQIIKTCITVLLTIQLLMEEARQPQFCAIKKEDLIKAAHCISDLQERGRELQGAA